MYRPGFFYALDGQNVGEMPFFGASTAKKGGATPFFGASTPRRGWEKFSWQYHRGSLERTTVKYQERRPSLLTFQKKFPTRLRPLLSIGMFARAPRTPRMAQDRRSGPGEGKGQAQAGRESRPKVGLR